MTKRDFFILLIKLFGLFSIVTSLFSILPSNIIFALRDLDVLSLTWILLAVIVVLGLFVLLVFRADKVLGILKLDKGFDDDRIELENVNAVDIVKIGTFIIGGLLILENIPIFLSHSLFAFKGDLIGQIYPYIDKFYWAVSLLNLGLGYLLITNYAFVARLLRTAKKE